MMDEVEQSEEGGGSGFRLDMLPGYVNFVKRAIRAWWILSAAVVVLGLTLAIVTAIYWPRTFSCTTVLMPVGNSLLDGKGTPPLLVGAEEIILRHENLEGIIRDVGLVQKSIARRPPILRLKSQLIHSLTGYEMTEKQQIAALVGTLEARIEVTIEKSDLTIKASWPDAQSAAELAEAARESFIRARHTAEMSAFEDKMAIYEQHASKIRNDIGTFAEQVAQSRDDRAKQAQGQRAARDRATDPGAAAAKPALRTVLVPRTAPIADTQLPALKEQLDSLKHKASELEADRDRRLREAQAKFEDLKVHLTPSHPDVVAQGERIARLSAVPSELASLRSEIKDVEQTIQQREGFARVGGGSLMAVGAGRPADALPTEITALLSTDDGDPALVAQLQGAISTYSDLRKELVDTRVELDTAQAAFNHRYQVIIPAEAPPKPDKPKPALIVIIGFVLSLLIGLILPLALELKKGVISERWQVEHQLPVLAELHLPPYSGD